VKRILMYNLLIYIDNKMSGHKLENINNILFYYVFKW